MKRRGGFRYVATDSNQAYYTHLLTGWQGKIHIYQENHLLERLYNNFLYEIFHPTKWTSSLELYKKTSASEKNKAEIAKLIMETYFDLLIAARPIELINDVIMLRAVKCPFKRDFTRENALHLTYKSASTFPGKSIIKQYYKRGNKCHFYLMNQKLGKIINSPEKIYPDMMAYRGDIHKVLKSF